MAILDADNRPALPIEAGTFGEPASGWELLEEHRERIDRAIACVGRLEIEGHPYLQWAGAATLVGPYLALTAGHMAQLFATGQAGAEMTLNRDASAFIMAGATTGSRAEYKLPVTAVRFVHPFFDIALCELGTGETSDTDEDSELGIPLGLTVAADASAASVGRDVAVISFAALDARNEPEAIEKVYGSPPLTGLYLQPGRIRSLTEDATGRPAIGHDCSTLAGSAGAPLLDLETGQVLGIHFAGFFGVENYAVPGWQLARDHRVRASAIQFSGDPEWMYRWAIADIAASRLADATGNSPVALADDAAEPEPDPHVHYFRQTELYRIRDLLNATGLARGGPPASPVRDHVDRLHRHVADRGGARRAAGQHPQHPQPDDAADLRGVADANAARQRGRELEGVPAVGEAARVPRATAGVTTGRRRQR